MNKVIEVVLSYRKNIVFAINTDSMKKDFGASFCMDAENSYNMLFR